MPHRLSEEGDFMEDDLLGVGQQLCMISEVPHSSPLPWEGARDNEERQEEEVGDASHKATETAYPEVVQEPAQHSVLSLGRLVEEHTVFVGLHSREACVVVAFDTITEMELGKLPNDWVLQTIVANQSELLY